MPVNHRHAFTKQSVYYLPSGQLIFIDLLFSRPKNISVTFQNRTARNLLNSINCNIELY